VYALGLSTQHPADLHIASSQDRFMLKFERNYGPVHPEFFSGSYASALAQANSQEKLLFVYLHSEEHDDAHLFCNQVLRNPEVIAFLNTNCIVFAADVCDPGRFPL
jgi:FAS-associated factor 2